MSNSAVDRAKADDDLAAKLGELYADPLGYVMFMFPWDTDTSIQLVELPAAYRERFPRCRFGPDLWACEFLDALGVEIRKRKFDGRTAVDPIRFASVSGHGIGKSVMVAWLIKFIMDTRPFSKGTITANTDVQLRTKTWAELSKWHNLSLTRDWFELGTGRGSMALRHREHPEAWFCTAQTSREENSESFAGQHAANATSFYIFDEASGIADKIYEVREGGLTDGEPMVFDWGNGTRNTGRFFEECRGKLTHRWITRSIDSRTVAITNKKLHAEWIADNGIDSDFVKVRILGQFPSQSSLQFMATDDVEAAMTRELPPRDRMAPLVIGVDVARSVAGDESVIYPRIGDDARSFEPRRFRTDDAMVIVGQVCEVVREFRNIGLETAAIFVDGGGIGGPVHDRLRQLGYPTIEVQFGSTKSIINRDSYRYKSDEMWGLLRDHIKTRLCLPAPLSRNGTDIRDDLTQREFGYTLSGNRMHLETKDSMKERGLSSPDLADALALTYAQEVAPRSAAMMQPRQVISEWDPLQSIPSTPHAGELIDGRYMVGQPR